MTGQNGPIESRNGDGETQDPQQDGTIPSEAAAAYARAQVTPEEALSEESELSNADAESEDIIPSPSELAEQVGILTAENRDLREQSLRTLAEMENLRRRTIREKEDAAKFAISRFAKDLLTVADNMQRALLAIPSDVGDGNDLMQTLAEGVSAVDRELAAVLERNGVRAIDALGQVFDSNLHEAVMEQPTADHAPGHVAQVFQTGYTLNDRLLRPAMVAVAKAVPGADPATEN